jgi:hypothetical protein
MAHLLSWVPLASVVTVEVDHVMNVLVSACGVVVILRVGDVSNVFQTIMAMLHNLTASVSCNMRYKSYFLQLWF